MVNRVFSKDKNIIDSVPNYHYNDSTPVDGEIQNQPYIRIFHWDNIGSVQQSLLTTQLATGNYTFDRDE